MPLADKEVLLESFLEQEEMKSYRVDSQFFAD
jgi:hypothetical protein